MTSTPIVSRLAYPRQATFPFVHFRGQYRKQPGYANLHTLYQEPQALPRFVRESAVAMHYLDLLGPLNWTAFPERDLETNWQISAMPYAPFVAACLVKLEADNLHLPVLLTRHKCFAADEKGLVELYIGPVAGSGRCDLVGASDFMAIQWQPCLYSR